jgi:hypothetical protein
MIMASCGGLEDPRSMIAECASGLPVPVDISATADGVLMVRLTNALYTFMSNSFKDSVT